MSADDAAFLAQLPHWGFAIGLMIARIGSACMLFPGIGEAALPATIRAGFTVALVVLLLPVIAPLMPPMPADVWRLMGMVGAEIVTGLWLGWLTRLLMLALPVAGQIISSVTGLTNVSQPDPALGAQTAALAHTLDLAAPVLIPVSGLHALPLSALAGSYRLIPPGVLLPSADTVEQVTGAVADAFALALRLASPFVLAGILWQVAMGLLARLVPRLQLHFAAMPGQILRGLALLSLLITALLAAWQGPRCAPGWPPCRGFRLGQEGLPGALPLDPTRAPPWTRKGTAVPLTPLLLGWFGEGGPRCLWQRCVSPPPLQTT